MCPYKVMVDDNFHYMEEDKRLEYRYKFNSR